MCYIPRSLVKASPACTCMLMPFAIIAYLAFQPSILQSEKSRPGIVLRTAWFRSRPYEVPPCTHPA